MKFDKMTTRQLDYMEGFIKKCAAHNVDPEVAIKHAANPYNIPGMPWAETMSGSDSLKTEPSVMDQAARGRAGIYSAIGKRLAKPDISGSVAGSGWDPRTWGRRLGRSLSGMSEPSRFLEGARNPTQLKGMFNIAGQQGAESGTRAVKQMSDLLKREKDYQKVMGNYDRQYSAYSPESKYDPKQKYRYGGQLKQYTPPQKVEKPVLRSEGPRPAPISM